MERDKIFYYGVSFLKVAFISVNYNNYLISLNNISNILSLKGDIEKDIVIVDNGSENRDYLSLKEGWPDVSNAKLIRSEKNLGYFGGLNIGLKSLTLSDYDYVIIANNDLIYKYDFLEVLCNSSYDNNCLVIAPELITIDGRYQNPQRVNKPSSKRQFAYSIYYSNYYISELMEFFYSAFFRKKIKAKNRIVHRTNIFQLTGACMVLTPEFFRRCGYLDDSVFMWGEEVILAHQVEKAGGFITYDPTIYVMHMENASVRKIPSKKSFEMRRNSYKKYKKYYK